MKDILRVREQITPLTVNGDRRYRLVPMTPLKRMGPKPPARKGLRSIDTWSDATVRMWVAVQQSGDIVTSYGVTFGSDLPRNAQFVTVQRITAVQAEYLATCWVLQTVPGGLQLAIVYCSEEVHVNMSIHFSSWEAGGGVDENEDPIVGATILRSVSELLSDRPMPVRWGLVAQAPRHCTYSMDVLQVGVRLRAPQPQPVSPGAEPIIRGCEP